jgi:hypothetical protein
LIFINFLRFLLLFDALLPAFVAHCGISVVSAEHYLVAFGDYPAVVVKSCIYSRFAAALADSFDFCD